MKRKWSNFVWLLDCFLFLSFHLSYFDHIKSTWISNTKHHKIIIIFLRIKWLSCCWLGLIYTRCQRFRFNSYSLHGRVFGFLLKPLKSHSVNNALQGDPVALNPLSKPLLLVSTIYKNQLSCLLAHNLTHFRIKK